MLFTGYYVTWFLTFSEFSIGGILQTDRLARPGAGIHGGRGSIGDHKMEMLAYSFSPRCATRHS